MTVPVENRAHEEIESDTIIMGEALKEAAGKPDIEASTRFVVSKRLADAIARIKATVARWNTETGKHTKGERHA